MPKTISEDELNEVLTALVTLGKPSSIEEITAALSSAPARRTLQRRLALLAVQDRLKAIGERGGRRYALDSKTVARPSQPAPALLDGMPPGPGHRTTSLPLHGSIPVRNVATRRRSKNAAAPMSPAPVLAVALAARVEEPSVKGDVLPGTYFWHLCAISS